MNILVLCPDNASRSVLLETLLNDLGAGRVSAFSAGLAPAGAVHPQALKLMEEEDLDTSHARAKGLGAFTGAEAQEIDILLSLGDGPSAPAIRAPGNPAKGHWMMTDPAALPEDSWEDGFRAIYDLLRDRAERLLEHPIETMEAGELTALLRRIGRG